MLEYSAPFDGTVWERLGGVSLLEEVHHGRMVVVLSLSPACDMDTQLPAVMPLLHHYRPDPSETVSTIKYFLL